MNATRDLGRTIYRWGVVACGTLVASQVIPFFVFPRLALALEGLPRFINGCAGLGLLVASVFYRQVRDPLYFIGLLIALLVILVWYIPGFI